LDLHLTEGSNVPQRGHPAANRGRTEMRICWAAALLVRRFEGRF